MLRNKGNFIIKFEKQDEEFVEKLGWDKLEKEYQKIKKFFDYDKEISPIKICFIYEPEEFTFFSKHKKHEEWMIAFAGVNNTIFIFAPSVVEEHTLHKKKAFFPTLIHEISHFFYRNCVYERNFPKYSLWNEGIAEYLAERENPPKFNGTLTKLDNYDEKPVLNIKGGFVLINCIMKEFGEEGNKKIIQFLNKVNDGWNQKELFDEFEEIFGVDPNKLIELQGGVKNE